NSSGFAKGCTCDTQQNQRGPGNIQIALPCREIDSFVEPRGQVFCQSNINKFVINSMDCLKRWPPRHKAQTRPAGVTALCVHQCQEAKWCAAMASWSASCPKQLGSTAGPSTHTIGYTLQLMWQCE